MFQVGRYDPRDEDRKKIKKNKSKRRSSEGKEEIKQKKKHAHQVDEPEAVSKLQDEKGKIAAATLRVIAPETEGAISSQRKLNTKLTEEAFDDLDLTTSVDDLIVEKDDDNEKEGQDDDDEDVLFDPTDEIQRALYMSKQPLIHAANTWGLAPFLRENLVNDSYQNFFPIQSLVIPDVIAAERHPQMRARDICVAAPTGSGKTLAFVLPVLNALANRKIRRLRALVVLPSRDLAKQVYEVFDRYSKGSDMKIGLAIGQSDFRAEKKTLVIGDGMDCRTSCSTEQLAQLSHSLDPGNLELCLNAVPPTLQAIPLGGISAVDVLVCTPGRLVDHLDNTRGFTLQHLRFLVIDEADRLLSQSYHGWIARVLDNATQEGGAGGSSARGALEESSDGPSIVVDPMTCRRQNNLSSVNHVGRPIQLRKFLYSATLTKDPQKLAALQLVNPKHFNAHHLSNKSSSLSSTKTSSLYSMPEQLQESTIECTAEQKPLVLLSLLLESIQNHQDDDHKSIIVVFTSSLESTHRLARLLQLLWLAGDYGRIPPVEFSSSLNQKQRSALMERCNDPNDPVSVVVCSDGMSRGMDISFVSAVINYDVPGFAKTYVHRCGRTARAGKQGEAISLLKGSGQVGLFTKLRRLIDFPERVRTRKVKTSLIRNAIPLYRGCVASLKDLIAAEQTGDLHPMDTETIEEYLQISNMQ